MSEVNKTSEKKLYEIGFHIVSSVNPEKVSDEVAKIKKTLTNNNADIVKEIEPKLINLAYQMTKKILDNNYKFDKAYFGSITFNSTTSDVEVIKSELESNNSILRFLLIKTVDDPEHSTNKIPREKISKKGSKEDDVVDTVDEIVPVVEADSEKADDESAEETAEAKEDIDEAIDELVK